MSRRAITENNETEEGKEEGEVSDTEKTGARRENIQTGERHEGGKVEK